MPESIAPCASTAHAPLVPLSPVHPQPAPSRLSLTHAHQATAVDKVAAPAVGAREQPLPLQGVPHDTLQKLQQALQVGPINLDLMQGLLAGGFAGTPLALALADHLAGRCALPAGLQVDEADAWRDVLLHALRLPATDWPFYTLPARPLLRHTTAQAHPLLAHLLHTVYRPHDLDHASWQARREAATVTDSRRLALEQQRAQCRGDMAARAGWMREQLTRLAPDLAADDIEHALSAMRRQENQEGGLLDPRVGLLALIERGTLEPCCMGPSSPLCTAAGPALPLPTPCEAPALATLLNDVAADATLAPVPTVTPLGRYTSIRHTLVSLLSIPGQLGALRDAGARLALAGERLRHGRLLGGPEGITERTRGLVPQRDWPASVQVARCTPLPGEAAVPAARDVGPLAMHARLIDTLLGPAPASTALMPPGQCTVETRTLSGRQRAQADAVHDFMRRQVENPHDAQQLQAAYARLLHPDDAAAVPPASLPVSPAPATSLWEAAPPRALAGALTDQGTWPLPEPAVASMLPGAQAQFPAEITGHAPLLLLKGLIDSVRLDSWWHALPGHVTLTPQGLLDALTDLFALAGVPLHDRPPTPEALEAFLRSAQGTALFHASERMPELAPWQRDEIDRGGIDTQLYAFLRMLKELMGRVHVSAHATHNGTLPAEDRNALYQLARIGDAGAGLLSTYAPGIAGAGGSYFSRAIRQTRSTAAHDPTPLGSTWIEAHEQRVRPPVDACPPISISDLRATLVDVPDPLLSDATFEAMSDAELCLAQIAVLVSRQVLGGVPQDWRTVAPDADAWRRLADRLATSDRRTLSWETGVGVYFHRLASTLRAWMAMPASPVMPPDLYNLHVFVRRLVEPLQQLYTALELPLHKVDAYYPAGHATFRQLYDRTGCLWSPAGTSEADDAARAAHWPLDAWLDATPGHSLARALCPQGAPSLRDGLVDIIQQALNGTTATAPDDLPALWTWVLDGPHAWQQWLDSPAGHNATMQAMSALHDVPVPAGQLEPGALDEGSARAEWFRTALRSQLPPGIPLPPLDGIPALFAHGSAPVLTLATQLVHHDRSLRHHPLQALLLAVALLPSALPAQTAPLPLAFPVWSTPLPPQPSTRDGHTTLLPVPWLLPPPAPTPPSLDTHALPPLDTLMARFGLNLLRGPHHDNALSAADAWALMARTQAFAGLGQGLLQQVGWPGGLPGDPPSPSGAQIVVAQAVLQHYLGRSALRLLHTLLTSPEVVNRTFGELKREVREVLRARQPDASDAAIDVLEWLVLRELQQPALLVPGVPDWLDYGRTLPSVAFLHGVQFVEAMQPGASARATFEQLSALSAQLAGAPAHAGERDALHDAWARALLQPALLYALAHGQLPDLTRISAATPAQAAAALAFLQRAHERQALHLGQIGAPAPQRRTLAGRTLLSAGIGRSLWSKRLVDLPAGFLETHNIVANTHVQFDQAVFDLAVPNGAGSTQDQKTAVVTADDTLLDLIAADAFVWTQGPTTRTLFDRAYAVYRNTLETGLAGVIEDLIASLPDADRALMQSGTCTPLRVKAFGHDAYQGLLLRCQPAGGSPAVHFEVIPSAGVMRRVWHDPQSGEWVELPALTDGTTSIDRSERLVPIAELPVEASATTVTMHEPNAVRTLAEAAARHLWTPRLDEGYQAELDVKTPLERQWDHEAERLTQWGDFLIPWFDCARRAAAGDVSSDTVTRCAVDALMSVMPAGRLAAETVQIVGRAGERSVLSLTADTGQALLRFGGEIAEQSGAFLIGSLGKGALWLGSQAWNGALQGVSWLRNVIRESEALYGTLENRVAHGTLPGDALASLDAGEATVVVGQVGASPPRLLVSGAHGWHRVDPIDMTAYGPPLQDVHLVAPLPDQVPTQPVEGGVRLPLGDETDARFVERSDGTWAVWIGDTPYLLDPADGSLRLREVHGHELGELQEVDATGCRVKRGVEAAPGSAGCGQPLRLRFVPDRRVVLPETPSVDELASHAYGYREYTPDSAGADRDLPPLDAASDDAVDSVHFLWPEPPRRLGPGATDPTGQLIVHDHALQTWHTQKQGRLVRSRLSPVTPEEAEALGIPFKVSYLPRVEGRLLPDDTLGLDDSVDALTRLQVNRQLPVIQLGPIATGVQDGRTLRGVRMTVEDEPAIVIEPDHAVYYWAPAAPDENGVLQFRPMQNPQDITRFLDTSEHYRLVRENPDARQLQQNVERMAFNYLLPGLGEHELSLYATYDQYVQYCRQSGHPNLLEPFARDVLSGRWQQKAFVQLGRRLIPDWSSVASCSGEQRQAIADVLNALLPLHGKEAGWVPLTAESLALPEAGHVLLKHFGGANFAFLRVETDDGTLILSSPSSGERAKRLVFNPPMDTDTVTYVNAGKAGVARNEQLLTLPVVRGPDGRIVVFNREGDSENWIFRWLLMALESDDPAIRLEASKIKELELWTLLDTCSTCGGAVVPTAEQALRALGFTGRISVRYMIDYVK